MFVDFHRRRFNNDFFSTHPCDRIRKPFCSPRRLWVFPWSTRQSRRIDPEAPIYRNCTRNPTWATPRWPFRGSSIFSKKKNKKNLVFHRVQSDQRRVTTTRRTKPKLETQIVNVYQTLLATHANTIHDGEIGRRITAGNKCSPLVPLFGSKTTGYRGKRKFDYTKSKYSRSIVE